MDFQAAPIDHEPIEASFDSFSAMDGSVDQHLDASMDAAMDAANNAADAVDDLVKHLTAAEAVEFVSNESASDAEPVIEEIIQQVQRSLEVPFLLITSTLVLGFIIIVAMFLRQRHRRLNTPKSLPVKEPEEEKKVVAETPSAEVAAAEDVEVTASKLEEPVVEKATVEEVVAEEVVAAVEEVTPSSEACEEKDIPCVAAAEPEFQATASACEEKDIPCFAAAEPEFQATASACPVETDLAEPSY